MSTLIQLGNEVGTQVLASHPMALPAAGGDGLLDWVSTKNQQTQTVLRAVAVTLAIIFVILNAIASRGAMARVIVSLIAAGVFVWGVWSVTDIKDRVENEMSMAPASVQVVTGQVLDVPSRT